MFNRDALLDTCFVRAQREILADLASGVLPADTDHFRDLHEVVDANAYGGLCDTSVTENFNDGELVEFGNELQARIHEWLQSRNVHRGGSR